MSDTPTGDHYEAVARRLAARACDRRRAELEDELLTITRRLRDGDDVRPADIDRARRKMNALRRLLEDDLAPLAGAEPWGAQPPSMPYDSAREHYHCRSE